MKHLFLSLGTAALMCLTLPSAASAELLFNPGFEDLDDDGNFGDGFGSFGAAGFNNFFGANGHASFFLDNAGNSGSVFQTGIAGTAGTEFTFSLTDVLIEANAAADVFNFGLEFFEADDSTMISSELTSLDLTPISGGVFSLIATAPTGTAFVRPIISFSGAVGTATASENVFVFDASLTATAIPEPSSAALFALASCVGLMTRRRRVIA